MKRFIAFLILSVLCMSVIAANGDWVRVQSVEIPKDTPVYYRYTESGNVQYYFLFENTKVVVSKINAEKFTAGIVRLELVKWRNRSNGRYKYTVRQIRPDVQDLDLSTLFP